MASANFAVVEFVAVMSLLLVMKAVVVDGSSHCHCFVVLLLDQ